MKATTGKVIGFLKVRESAAMGFRAGYLLTNEYGKPIEFHFTSELVVQKTHRLLYGAGFEPYLFVEVLGKPLTDRQSTAPRAVLVDHPALLGLRKQIPAPVLFISLSGGDGDATAETHAEHPEDLAAFDKLRDWVPSGFQWSEPFERILSALEEVEEPNAA